MLYDSTPLIEPEVHKDLFKAAKYKHIWKSVQIWLVAAA
jgi:hypothetical protein